MKDIIYLKEFTSRGGEGYSGIRKYAYGKPLRVKRKYYLIWTLINYVKYGMVPRIRIKIIRKQDRALRRRRIAEQLITKKLYFKHRKMIRFMDKTLSKNTIVQRQIKRARQRVISLHKQAKEKAMGDEKVCGHCGSVRKNMYYPGYECVKHSNGWNPNSCNCISDDWDRSCPNQKCGSQYPMGKRDWYMRLSSPEKKDRDVSKSVGGKMISFPKLWLKFNLHNYQDAQKAPQVYSIKQLIPPEGSSSEEIFFYSDRELMLMS